MTRLPGAGRAAPWLHAIRPRTLPVAVVPVIVGSSLAAVRAHVFSVAIFVLAAAVAVLIQAGTNLHNDVADFERGGDDPALRIGPRRATAEGWLSPDQVRQGAFVCLGLALCTGLLLTYVGGWIVLLLGSASLAAAWAYSGGPRPISYSPLGELFVWVFFGLVAVAGTYYLQTGGRLDGYALAAGAIMGLPAAAVLVVNNTRDRDADRAAGRRTFAVVFGPAASQVEYGLLVLPPIPAAMCLVALTGGWIWLPLAAAPMAVWLVWRFAASDGGPELNRLLGMTAAFELLLGLLLSAALLSSGHGGRATSRCSRSSCSPTRCR
jgi:1,4-dihydroxy-2-naphthoate octaprenyltransferase